MLLAKVLETKMGFFHSSVGKESVCNISNHQGSIPGSERSSGEGNGNQLQYSCLENSMDREAWGCKELDTTEWLTQSIELVLW